MRKSTESQNVAAGGIERRQLRLGDGSIACAFVSVRTFKIGYQSYGYLQFRHQGKTVTRYIGQISAGSREESLVLGWQKLRSQKIAEQNGWKWVRTPRA
jgi:hypothetical protein